MKNKVCFITGVGDGTGAALAKRFSIAGYRVAMVARNTERLQALEAELPNSRSFICDLEDLEGLNATLDSLVDEMGMPDIIIHNAVRATFQPFLSVETVELERNFRVNTTALYAIARYFAPAMIQRGTGTIISTGNTAALRGTPNFAAFAPTKAAQRILCQSLARDLGPKGIHVAYVVIDAAIDTPWTREPFHSDKPEDFFSLPSDIADEIFHVAHQPRSTWSFDVEIRPFGETW